LYVGSCRQNWKRESEKLLPRYAKSLSACGWTEDRSGMQRALEGIWRGDVKRNRNWRWWKRQRAARVSPAIVGLSTVLVEFSFFYFSHVQFFHPVTCLGCNIYEPFVALINQEKSDHTAQHDASQSQRRGETLFSSFTWDSFHPISQNNLCFHNICNMYLIKKTMHVNSDWSRRQK
jgi:hypothetical protein